MEELNELNKMNESSIFNEVNNVQGFTEINEINNIHNLKIVNRNNEPKFCTIIENFCDSLVKFAIYVRQPTTHIYELIHKKNTRNNAFDGYVITVEEFNNILLEIINLLNQIILSLNALFVNRTLDAITNFLDQLRIFLLHLLNNNILIKLNMLKKIINEKYIKDIDILKKIANVKYLIFRMCNLSIDITSMFIPQLSLVKEVIVVLEKKSDDATNNQIDEIKSNNIKLDNIIKQLLDIQLRSQIISSFGATTILNCLVDKQSDDLIRIIENLQTEYVEIIFTTVCLKTEIDAYKTKKRSVISSLFRSLIKSK